MKSWVDWSALALRVIFGCLVLYDVAQGAWFKVAFFGCIWIVIYAFALLGRSHKHYAYLDSIILLFFILAWNAPNIGIHMESDVLGVDKVFHTSGGALLGLVGLAITARWVPDPRARACFAVLFALGIGGGWEVFEWVFHISKPVFMATTYNDSMLDIVADTLGGMLVAVVWYVWHRNRAPAKVSRHE